MDNKTKLRTADYVEPLNMNNLHGRVLHLPAPKRKKRQILLVYGHHASLERMFGFAEELNRYGAVAMPDLPGFGGMESFYKINEVPTIDNMADYLAAFIQMHYKHRRLTIVGMSYGFVIVTRMLQRYPDLAKKVDDLISIVGFVHREDFKLKPSTMKLLRTFGRIGSWQLPAIFIRYIVLSRPMIYLSFALMGDHHAKMAGAGRRERLRRIKFEVKLWHANDVRTYAFTGLDMLRVDLCNKSKPINLPVTHVEVDEDRYFDNRIVEQHLGVIYEDVTVLKTKFKGHAPTVISSAKEVEPFIPRKLRTILKSTKRTGATATTPTS